MTQGHVTPVTVALTKPVTNELSVDIEWQLYVYFRWSIFFLLTYWKLRFLKGHLENKQMNRICFPWLICKVKALLDPPPLDFAGSVRPSPTAYKYVSSCKNQPGGGEESEGNEVNSFRSKYLLYSRMFCLFVPFRCSVGEYKLRRNSLSGLSYFLLPIAFLLFLL